MRYVLFMVLVLVVSWSGISVAGTSSVFGSVSQGKVYFSKRCAMCHGADGHGNNGMAPDFSVEWNRLTKSDDELAANIREVYKDPTRKNYYNAGKCPRHPTISDGDMEDILAFLRHLAEKNSHGGMLDSSDDFFDKQFDDFGQEDDGFGRNDGFEQNDGFERDDGFVDQQ